MDFVIKYMWDILETLEEERKNDTPMSYGITEGLDIFVGAASEGKDAIHYKHVDAIGREKIANEWNTLTKEEQAAEKNFYKHLVTEHYGEITDKDVRDNRYAVMSVVAKCASNCK